MKERITGIWRLGYIPGRALSIFMAIILLCSFVTVSAWAADSAAEAERIVDTSRKALEGFIADPQMSGFRNSLKNAKAVLIIPELLKAGIIVAGSGGNGVFLLRDEKTDQWSYPYFYTKYYYGPEYKPADILIHHK